MIGRVIGIILLVLLALVLLILFVPGGVRFGYGQGDVSLAVRFGPVRKKIFPAEKKAGEPGREKKQKPKKKEKPGKENEKPPKAKINREQILYSLEKLPPILSRALGSGRRRVRIRPLKLHVLVAGYDPADTALLYGKLEGALAAGLPALRRAVHIRDEDVRLFLDFSQERMDCIAEIGLSIRVWDLLAIGVGAGWGLLKWFRGFRALASPPPPAPEKKPDRPPDQPPEGPEKPEEPDGPEKPDGAKDDTGEAA